MAIYTNGNLAYQTQQKSLPHQQRIRKVNKKSLPVKEKLFYLLTVLFVVILAGFIISGYAQISEYNYSIQNLEKSIAKTNEENDTLQLKIAELSAPERIIKIAQEELGMALNEEQVIILSKTLN